MPLLNKAATFQSADFLMKGSSLMLSHKTGSGGSTVVEYRIGEYVERLRLKGSRLALEWHNPQYSSKTYSHPTTTKDALKWMAGNESVIWEFGIQKSTSHVRSPVSASG